MTFFLIDNDGTVLEIYNPLNITINWRKKQIGIKTDVDTMRGWYQFDIFLRSDKTDQSWFFQVDKATELYE